jgi:hypothetical protein
MNKKNKVIFIDGGIHLHNIPYKLNQLPYKPTITLAVDKSTQSIIGFSIQETHAVKNVQTYICQIIATSINCARNSIAYHFTGIPRYVIDDGSTDFSTASYVKALKEFSWQPKLASDDTVIRRIEIDHTLADVFVTLSQPLHRYSRPSPKNPPLGELWRQRSRRFPQS